MAKKYTPFHNTIFLISVSKAKSSLHHASNIKHVCDIEPVDVLPTALPSIALSAKYKFPKLQLCVAVPIIATLNVVREGNIDGMEDNDGYGDIDG